MEMREFYVEYQRDGLRHIGIVSAAAQPDRLQFASPDEFKSAMDSLGIEWRFHGEIVDPDERALVGDEAWLKMVAEAKALTPQPKPKVVLNGESPGPYPVW